MLNLDEIYMQQAFKEALIAKKKDEVPVGSVIVYEKKIIAKSHNMSIRLCDPTAHAEIQAITSACNYLKSRYLENCTIYTTLEPCIMCAGALFWAKIGRIVYGASDKKQGMSLIKHNIIHPKTKINSGVLEYECGYLLSDFFKKKRKLK